MQINRSFNRPIKVDDCFLDEVGRLIVEFRELVLDFYAKSFALNRSEIEELSSIDPESISPSSDKEANKYLISLRVQRNLNVSHEITYDDGYKFDFDNLEDLRDTLGSHVGKPEQISISGGLRDELWFRIRITERSYSTCEFEIVGQRRECDLIDGYLSRLCTQYNPDLSVFHTQIPYYVLSISVWIIAMGLIFSNFDLRPDELSKQALQVFAVGGMLGFTAGGICTLPMKYFRSVFPRCEIALGPFAARRKSAANVLWACLSVIALPIALALIPFVFLS